MPTCEVGSVGKGGLLFQMGKDFVGMAYKVCVVTAARSEYGLLRWVLDALRKDERFVLQLVVTGAHLSVEQGLTYQQIEEDGFQVDEKVEMLLNSETAVGIAKSMGLCAIGMGECFQRLKPDILVVLGDRYELLPICSVALIYNLPIAHISGGDVTEGAIDNEIRNAITMMASLHFPGVEDSAERIIRMTGTSKNVHVVGEPGLENFVRYELYSRRELSKSLHLDENAKWVLLTYHSETKLGIEHNLEIAHNIISCLLDEDNTQIVISKSNSDLGGAQLNVFWEQVSKQYPDKFLLYPSLGQRRYLSLMKEANYIIGNSSSGIVEAPFLGVPVVNVGERQKGRHICKNVQCVDFSCGAIKQAIRQLECCNKTQLKDTYYGDGDSAKKIVEFIKSFLDENARA